MDENQRSVGWHPDAHGGRTMRYFDGRQWTTSRAAQRRATWRFLGPEEAVTPRHWWWLWAGIMVVAVAAAVVAGGYLLGTMLAMM